MTRLESKIAEYFGRRHAIVVGSGTTALYCCFRGLSLPKEAKVLFPDITCETAVNAAIFAELDPVFADVLPESYTLDPTSVSRLVATHDVAAMVPTHIFGHLTDIPVIEEAAGTSIPIIEDAAQGYGGELGERRVGTFGLASIVSFGPGKTLSCGTGGAILTDDENFSRSCRLELSLLQIDAEQRLAERKSVMNEVFQAKRKCRTPEEFNLRRIEILRSRKQGYLSSCSEEGWQAIERLFDSLPQVIAARCKHTSNLDASLQAADAITLPTRLGKPVLWRYCFRTNHGQREDLIEELRSAGLEVSKLFPPCHRSFGTGHDSLPVSVDVAESIVNVLFPESIEAYPQFEKTITSVLV